MKLHILGICGTFMGGIAALAREAGHQVTGSDAQAWPPMSTQLEALGITLYRGYDPAPLQQLKPDLVVVGNVVSRGNPAMEYVLDVGLPYVSGPEWLAEHVLRGRHVIAIAGTHGKTTTTSLLAFLLDRAGLEPGFLVGGVPLDFGLSARLGSGPHFVIEADEYDTAFFDKRSKFVHYRPRTAVLNNLEFDHADIFPDLAAIERQFHQLVRTVPGNGRLIVNADDAALAQVLAQGCWTPVDRFGGGDGYRFEQIGEDFELCRGDLRIGTTRPTLHGAHNRSNLLAALAAGFSLGVPPKVLLDNAARFGGVRRRQERVGVVEGVEIYDDFAHHPTAIAATIAALREDFIPGSGRVLAVVELRSNTMRLGAHAATLAGSLAAADAAFVFVRPDVKWDAAAALSDHCEITVHRDLGALVTAIVASARPRDRVLVMSNGDFGGIHGRLLAALANRPAAIPARAIS
jgi:UDP-N-acetylmuramate: L-alanyl-gamma-D-glutamyl-meso-diaminopimelate ligase